MPPSPASYTNSFTANSTISTKLKSVVLPFLSLLHLSHALEYLLLASRFSQGARKRNDLFYPFCHSAIACIDCFAPPLNASSFKLVLFR
ncbi:hypothetical protein B0H15DRAFT_825146 [Mycena belliarum]|uniref:Uncharacterized protein n=1 Tax=Mycena belliarum TaxID=1033014 RepID=A0AAD6XR25_9AGAR|nr:hypothetical protein B0H15DRAFT_825146 [Mycena belliae]